MTEQQINENIAKHIWNDILQCSMKPFKWGFEFKTVQTIPGGTSFRVNTDYIIGLVEIRKEQQDCFIVTIKPDNYGGSLIYEHLSSQNLISTIDRVVREGILVDNRESQTPMVAA